MSATIEELTVNYEEGGQQIVKELDKVVVSKGAWTTILFKYQQWQAKKEEYGPEKYTIRRYRKMNGVYRQQGKFNISSREQAGKIVDCLQTWLDEDA